MFLVQASIVVLQLVILTATVVPLWYLRRWVRSESGKNAVSAWPAKLFIPLNAGIAVLWLVALFNSPTVGWAIMALVTPPWSALLTFVQLVFMVIFVPVFLGVVGNSWLKSHLLPEWWSLQRIWLAGVAGIGVAMLTGLLGEKAGFVAGALIILIPAAVLFLTRWWLITHPIKTDQT